MAEDNGKKYSYFNTDSRRLSVIVLALFSAWLLAVPFEGRVLSGLLDYYRISPQPYILGAMAAHCGGLFLCGFFVKNIRTAKRLMLISVLICIASSIVFFFPLPFLLGTALIISSFLAGCFVAAWGFFLKNGTPESKRVLTIADMLVLSYILTTLLGMAAVDISPLAGLGFSILPLGAAFFFALRLPEKEAQPGPTPERTGKTGGIAKPLFLLCLFITAVALNVGLMFQVQYPAFAHLDWLTSWFWAVPYIAAVLIVRNLPRRINRAYILYAAIAMTGFSFIAFILMDRSAGSYLVVNTLMVGSFGIFNLFWWSILGEMLSLHRNPARVLGTGLFANVLGAFLGAIIGSAGPINNGQDANITLLSLGVVCATLVLLPILHGRLTILLKDHAFLTALTQLPQQEKNRMAHDLELDNRLTGREREIAALLLTGKTYRTIAAELCVSENTVKTHAKNVYAKTGAHNRTELMNSLLDIRPPFERS